MCFQNKGDVTPSVVSTIDFVNETTTYPNTYRVTSSGPTSFADEELKDTIMVAMSKLFGEGFYVCTICVEYEWKPLKCPSCKIFGHFLDEYPMNIISDVVKNFKNPSEAA
ncbi:hypothetical protein Tco_0758265 [Tanacetum coccineum]